MTKNANTVKRSAYERLVVFLASRVERQEEKYGPFDADIAGVRLALAVLQDELDEARDEWRHERTLGSWDGTAEEVADIAAVALRLLLALEDDLAGMTAAISCDNCRRIVQPPRAKVGR